MASPSGLTSKTKSMDAFVCVYVCTSDEFCAEEREYVSRSQRVSVEESESECRDVREKRVRQSCEN